MTINKNKIAASISLEQKALVQLKSNLRSGYDPFYKTSYSYVIPSPGRYKWQWFWDSCFHAIALSKLDSDMAKRELITLLKTQRNDGFIGHIIYWGRFGSFFNAIHMQGRFGEWRRRHSGMLQPPVLAQAVEAIYHCTRDKDFLSTVLPNVNKYYKWISNERDINQSGLINIISPFESGMDNSPAFDEVLNLKYPTRNGLLWANRKLDLHNLFKGNYNFRRLSLIDKFSVIDPMVNAVFADGLSTLSRLHYEIGDIENYEITALLAQKTEQAINKFLWDETKEHYIYLEGLRSKPITILTAACLMPLINEGTPSARANILVDRYLTNTNHFWTPYPVPTVSKSEPSYSPNDEKTIWRGPVCMNINWLLIRGLKQRGLNKQADELIYKSRFMASQDLREFYSPENGRGMRGERFGWATLAVNM